MYRKTTEQIEQGLEFQNKAFNSFLEAKGKYNFFYIIKVYILVL